MARYDIGEIDPQKGPIVLVEMDGYDPSTATVKTLRFANQRGVHTSSTDTPARTPYPGRLVNPAAISINLIEAWTKGFAPTQLSEIQLSNSDGGLDYIRPWTFDGYPVRLYLGTINGTTANTLTKTLIFEGTMEQPDISRRLVTAAVRSIAYSLDKPVTTKTFAGTGDQEGGADVAGKIKPFVYGELNNVEAILIDSARLIYYFAQNARIYPGQIIKDAGVNLTPHTTEVTYAALKALAVPAGKYSDLYQDAGVPGLFVKLGSTPVGQVTADSLLTTDSLSGSDLSGNINKLMDDAGIATRLTSNDFTYPATVGDTGRLVNDDSTFLAVLGDFVSNIIGWIWYNPLGISGSPRWMLGNLPKTDNTGVVRAVVSDSDIIDMVRLGNPKTLGEGIPPQSVILESQRNNTVQTSGLAAGSFPNWRTFVGREYRTWTNTDTSVLTRYPLAQTVKVTAKACAQFNPSVPSAAISGQGLWDALQLGYEYYQITVKFKPALFQVYNDATNRQWIPAIMPAFGTHRLGVRTRRFGFLNTGKGTQVAPMNVLLDFQRKRITYVVRTTYQPG